MQIPAATSLGKVTMQVQQVSMLLYRESRRPVPVQLLDQLDDLLASLLLRIQWICLCAHGSMLRSNLRVKSCVVGVQQVSQDGASSIPEGHTLSRSPDAKPSCHPFLDTAVAVGSDAVRMHSMRGVLNILWEC